MFISAMLESEKKFILHLIKKGKNLVSRVNPSPIWVLGNQKSGTTAIASLIAEYGGLTSNIDFDYYVYEAFDDLIKVAKNQLIAEEFIYEYQWEFSKDLIKDPTLTFLFDRFCVFFPNAKIIFIIRDPRDNIRSILNRVALPGNQVDIRLEQHPQIFKPWKQVLLNDGFNIKGNTYIKRLAYRWCAAVDIYLENKDRMMLVRYEDFKKQKNNTITNICRQLSIPQKADIAEKVDIQYQPKGSSSVNWGQFFGLQNLHIIKSICASRMRKLGYNLKTSNP